MQEKLVGNTINIKNSFCHLLYGNQIDHICEKNHLFMTLFHPNFNII